MLMLNLIHLWNIPPDRGHTHQLKQFHDPESLLLLSQIYLYHSATIGGVLVTQHSDSYYLQVPDQFISDCTNCHASH